MVHFLGRCLLYLVIIAAGWPVGFALGLLGIDLI